MLKKGIISAAGVVLAVPKRPHLHILGGLALLVAAALLIPAVRVWAHAAYDHSTPAKDEVVPTEPAQLDVFFKEKIFKSGDDYLRVFADDNTTQVSPGDGTVDDNDRTHMFTSLPTGLPDGRYIVHWATVSDDDFDKDSGMYCFYIVTPPTAAQQAQCASFAPTAVPTISGTAQGTSAATPAQTSGATSASTVVVTPADTGGGGGNTGVIVGVIVAVIAVVVVGGAAGLWWRSRQA